MPLFGRKSTQRVDWKHAPCTPVDSLQWWREVALRAPRDGRYFVAWLVERDGQLCLLFELAATRTEAQNFLQEFAHDYRTKPQRINEMHFDDLDGSWWAHRRGFPDGLLQIMHPDSIEIAEEGL